MPRSLFSVYGAWLVLAPAALGVWLVSPPPAFSQVARTWVGGAELPGRYLFFVAHLDSIFDDCELLNNITTAV